MIFLSKINKNTISFSSIEKQEEKIVKKSLTIFIEGAKFSQKYKIGLWDGFKRFYRNNTFKLGLLDEVIAVLRTEEIDFQYTDSDFRNIKIEDIELDKKLRSHQAEEVSGLIW